MVEKPSQKALVVRRPVQSGLIAVPGPISGAGEHASRRFLEFFAATIRNKNTREAYFRAVCRFFAWCEKHRLHDLADIEPLHVAAYVEQMLQKPRKDAKDPYGKPTVKQNLAAIRMCFDWLVTGQVLAVNPAHAVRGPKHVVKRGKTPVLSIEDARALLDSIDATTLVGLRDRALIGVMTYSFARVGAVVAMRVEDYYAEGKRWWLRLHEKGGKRRVSRTHRQRKGVWSCTGDEGGALEAGSQVQASNRCKLRPSRATVVSVAEKPGQDLGRYDPERRAQANRR